MLKVGCITRSIRKIQTKLITSTYEGIILSPFIDGNLCFPSNDISNQRRAFQSKLVGKSSHNPFALKHISTMEDNSKSLSTEEYYHPSASNHYELMNMPSEKMNQRLSTLTKDGQISRFNVYKPIHLRFNNDDDYSTTFESNQEDDANNDDIMLQRNKIEVAVADIHVGDKLSGHDGFIHGGVISLLFDEALAWGYDAIASIGYIPLIVTANLNIDYRRPIPVRSDIFVRIYHERNEGRKHYMSACMESHDGLTLYAEAKVLFVNVEKVE